MLVSVRGDTRRHVLLPFKADACDIGPLRHAVTAQLVAWGASQIADAVTLSVSELATNVVCHVGAGTPAALLLESTGDRLRVELHDTSRSLPSRTTAASDDESGRGLALVAAIAGGWIATPTPGGKAVCCEFTVPSASHRRRWSHRINRASEVIEGYGLSPQAPQPRISVTHAAADTVAVDLITDLLHWLAANGHDPDTVLDHAQTHFEAETAHTGGPELP